MLPAHAREWMDRAEIDYIGPFVKSWAAFNAWYRHASGATQERQMLDFAIGNANSRLRRRVLPFLTNANTTAEAERLKQAICDLQMGLDAIHFEVTPKGRRERVSLREVCIQPKHLQQEQIEKHAHRYRAAKITGGAIEITVAVVRTSNIKFSHVQTAYDSAELFAQATLSSKLSPAQRFTLGTFYDTCNPRPMIDLVQGSAAPVSMSTMQFQCTAEQLLAGLVETLYAMRNALLHGEVDPDEQVLACYEPAYRIIMNFLEQLA